MNVSKRKVQKNDDMRLVKFLWLVSFIISGCSDKKAMVCDCCEQPYSDMNIAVKCIERSPIVGTSSDERMLLLALTYEELEPNQKLSWNIVDDPEIVKVAKRNYLLVVLNVNDFIQNIKDNNELLRVIKSHDNESLFFVITNKSLYPFGDWNNHEEKNIIIDRLEIGNGP